MSNCLVLLVCAILLAELLPLVAQQVFFEESNLTPSGVSNNEILKDSVTRDVEKHNSKAIKSLSGGFSRSSRYTRRVADAMTKNILLYPRGILPNFTARVDSAIHRVNRNAVFGAFFSANMTDFEIYSFVGTARFECIHLIAN